MGLFCVNFHFRTTDDKALSAALAQRRIQQHHLFPAQGPWISLCEEQASQQDDERIREIASGLSADLHVPAIAFLVHDSDVACYWLFENGKLVDEYNSCPDYFEDEGADPPQPSGGRPEVLLRYCRSGVREEDLKAILGEHTVFAEQTIERLADALEIDASRALADYRHLAGGEDSDGDANDDYEDDDGSPPVASGRADMAASLMQMLGMGANAAPADPKVQALVEAAAADNTDEIDRLLAEGIPVDGEAPTPLSGGLSAAELASIMPGGGKLTVPTTPLLAALSHKHKGAAAHLLERGADPNRVNPVFGTPVHAVTSAGEAELLQLLIDRGGDVSARDARGQTPLQALAAARATAKQLAQMQEMMKAMGGPMAGMMEKLSNVALPKSGWDACEQLLKAHGG